MIKIIEKILIYTFFSALLYIIIAPTVVEIYNEVSGKVVFINNAQVSIPNSEAFSQEELLQKYLIQQDALSPSSAFLLYDAVTPKAIKENLKCDVDEIQSVEINPAYEIQFTNPHNVNLIKVTYSGRTTAVAYFYKTLPPEKSGYTPSPTKAHLARFYCEAFVNY